MAVVNEILLKEENGELGLFKRTYEDRRVANADALLQAFAADITVKIEGVFEHEEQAVNLSKKGNVHYLWTNIHALPMRTRFKLEEGKLWPTFSAGMDLSLIWTCPSDMRLTIGFDVVDENGEYKANHAYLFARNGTPGFWKLPVSNIYSDGRLCLGNDLPTFRGGNLADLWKQLWLRFSTSSWGTDLVPNPEMAKGMFQFEAGTHKSLPVPNWAVFCQRFSHPAMSNMI